MPVLLQEQSPQTVKPEQIAVLVATAVTAQLQAQAAREARL